LNYCRLRFSIGDQMGRKSAVSKYLAEIGRKGGKKSAKLRMEKLTPAERTEIARNAADARWAKKRKRRP